MARRRKKSRIEKTYRYGNGIVIWTKGYKKKHFVKIGKRGGLKVLY